MLYTKAPPAALFATAAFITLLALNCSDSAGNGSTDAGTCQAGYVMAGGKCVLEGAGGDCLKNGCPQGLTCNQLIGLCAAGTKDAGGTSDTGAPDDGGIEDDGAVDTDGGGTDAGLDAGLDAGQPDGGTTLCNKGTRQCDVNRVVECNASGTGWVFAEDCTPACDANKCITGCWNGVCTSKPKICEPLETHCCDFAEHKHPPYSLCGKDDLLQCDVLGIEWGVKENCMTKYTAQCGVLHPDGGAPYFGCLGAAAKICTAGDKKCSNSTLMECKVDGTGWYEKEKCAGCCQQTAQSTACIEGAGTDNSVCTSDCECKGGYICVGWGIAGDKVCRRKCGPVTTCPSGQSCGSGYYCTPD